MSSDLEKLIRTKVEKLNSLWDQFEGLAITEAGAIAIAHILLDGVEGLCAKGWKRGVHTLLYTDQAARIAKFPIEDFKEAAEAAQRAQRILERELERLQGDTQSEEKLRLLRDMWV